MIVPVVAFVVRESAPEWLTGHRDLYEGLLLALIREAQAERA